MKKYIIIFSLFASYCAMAQEFFAPVQNQYIADNPYLISSAYAGIGDCWQLRASGFEQWVSIEDSPGTQSLSIDGRISDRSGVGAILFNDQNGFTTQKGVQLSFAHHLTLNEYNNQYLSFGISYKFTQFGIDTSDFNNGDPDNPVSPGLADVTVNNSNFDIGFLYRLGRFFLSANAVNLLQKEIDDFNPTEPATIQNYYLYTGYTFYHRFSDIEIEPSVLYQNFAGDGRSTADLNLKVRKMNRGDYYWAGVSVRSLVDQDFKPLSVSPMLGIKMANFYVAYGYQINVNEVFEPVGGAGSHLITLGFDFGCRQSKCGCTY
ncbi:type IX secretion system membrane protein PorP/SprF [Aquimarina sp. 2201CG5-10]|uniref:PorP/SprF family type IX secretion system membrane protein n=1 Tax=Aquimarina callyspongiae TaxID=3098150 RepID=UPI002AB3C77B|nr:type IX secretion system membrane protein PorP/SprF [Aquimarina sp. 2201CG5-10]MDY8138649.1 type IX secretion system membrane protein PorP/SprF [Aquimarina sp. 2201CG5-10]